MVVHRGHKANMALMLELPDRSTCERCPGMDVGGGGGGRFSDGRMLGKGMRGRLNVT